MYVPFHYKRCLLKAKQQTVAVHVHKCSGSSMAAVMSALLLPSLCLQSSHCQWPTGKFSNVLTCLHKYQHGDDGTLFSLWESPGFCSGSPGWPGGKTGSGTERKRMSGLLHTQPYGHLCWAESTRRHLQHSNDSDVQQESVR